jgi:hypothetical protein
VHLLPQLIARPETIGASAPRAGGLGRWRAAAGSGLTWRRVSGEPPADTGQLRGDLVQILTQMASAMAGPVGRSLYALIVEMVLQRESNPRVAAAIIETLLEPRLDAITAALRRAAKRGEIRPGAVTGLLAQTGPALVIHQQMHYGTPPSEAEITEIVDRVLLPALGAPTTAASQ